MLTQQFCSSGGAVHLLITIFTIIICPQIKWNLEISMQFNITKNISSELTVFSSVSFGNVQWHWKISPKMGLYGFLATDPFLPAWKAERYHFTTWTIRSLASFWSLMLQGRKTKFNVLLSDRTQADAALLHMVHYKPGREDPGPRVFKTET